MKELKQYLGLIGLAIKRTLMETANHFQDGSSLPVKIYFLLLHILLISLALYIFIKPRNKQDKHSRTRTFKRENRAVTIETCEWVNSTVAWFYLHSRSNNTPDLVKIWVRTLNRQLYKERKKGQRILITNVRPGCLPPKLTNVYCLCVDSTMQCITFHIESTELGFHVTVNQPSSNGKMKPVFLEVNVTRLVGEVALQLNNTPSLFEVSFKFIGEPDIDLSTKVISEDEVDAATIEAVEEKVKEVICKTVTNVPVAETGTKADTGSLGKDKLAAPILQSCLGEEGKLLIKVIKALGLATKDKSDTISPYCILSTGNPSQRRRTSLMKDTHNPFWNEYFAFDINSKTREITVDIFDYEKTVPDCNHHMDDDELTQEQDDFLGQVIVPLSTVNRDQTCRLVLPILPRTNKCDYVSGELSLEFDFDKDGKVIDKAFPLVADTTETKRQSSVVEETVVVTETESKVEAEPETDGPSTTKTYSASYSYSLDKRYMETSLDELAYEIEAYEAATKPRYVIDETDEAAERLVTMDPVFESKEEPVEVKEEKVEPEPETVVVLADTKDGKETEETKEEELKQDETEKEKEEISEPEKPVEESTPKMRTKKSFGAKFKRRPKSTADMDKKSEDEQEENKRHSYHPGDTIEERDEEGEEEAAGLTPEPKSKIRRSFNMKFRRSKKEEKEKEVAEGEEKKDGSKEDKKDDGETEKKDEALAVSAETTPEPPKSRFSKFKRAKKDGKEKEADGENKDTEEVKDGTETKEGVEATPVPPKSRFSKFKKAKKDEKDKSVEEGDKKEGEEAKESEETAPEPRKSRFGGFKRAKKDGKEKGSEGETKDEGKGNDEETKEPEKAPETEKEGEKEGENEKGIIEPKEKPEEPKETETKLAPVDENAEAGPSKEQPKPRLRKFNLKFGRQRPVSMSAFDKPQPGTSTDDDTKRSRDERVRHSYHAGDLEPPQIRKSTSQSSLLSYSPNPNSSLIIETSEKGEKKYYNIPPAMAKRGTYEQKGVKYHVYNDHMFRAYHIGEATDCAVCGNSIMRKVGKQAYRCKDCKMATHKKCHSQTTVMCPSSTVKSLPIERAGGSEV